MNLNIIAKKIFGLINLTKAQTFYIYQLVEVSKFF